MSNREWSRDPIPPAVALISAAQCRCAPGLLAWTQSQLALRANVSRMTIIEFEAERRITDKASLLALRRALEAAGITFIEAVTTTGLDIGQARRERIGQRVRGDRTDDREGVAGPCRT